MKADAAAASGARRSVQLDVLRGVAILLVVGRHLELPRPSGAVGALAELWFRLGWLGVDLFFVLSGFLIGGLLLAEHERYGGIDVRRFLIRRGLKIYPPYLAFMAYLLLMPTAKAFVGSGDALSTFRGEWSAYWPNLVFLQNYVGENPAGHTWSLAVEEHFYIVLPMVLVALGAARGMRALPMLCLAVVPACVLFLRILSVWTADSFAVRMAATHLRLDALLFGVGIRSVAQYWPVRFAAMERWRGVLLLAGICLWLPHAFEPGPAFTRTIGLTFTYLGAGAFLIAACHTHAASFGSLRRVVTPLASAIAGIGVYSYAIYLWHVTTIGIVERVVGAPVLAMVGTSNELGWLGVVLVASASVVTVGIVASRAVEWPVLRLRERFFPSRTSSSGTRVDAATGGVTPEVAATVGVQGPESQSALSTSVQ